VHPQSDHDLSSRNSGTHLDSLLKASSVARRFDISVRTLDRWLLAPHRVFPAPVMFTRDCSGRVSGRFWRLSDLIAWEQAQAATPWRPGTPRSALPA
jgi:hypothetical protein